MVEGGRYSSTALTAVGGAETTDGPGTAEARMCGVWPLPPDATCASVARRAFRCVAGALGLDPEVAGDGMTMVSELAANTLHARQEQGGPRAAAPELWLYLRGAGPRTELVCKVFDAFPGWLDGNVPGRGLRRALPDATSGRGLQVVHELSGGRWGYHPTRARLGGWQVRGKAVWFAVPAATAAARAARAPAPASMRAAAAMTEFEKALTARGFTGELVRADDPAADMAVLSLRGDLTVWCWCGLTWLRVGGTGSGQWGYGDLVEAAEQTVEAYETLAGVTEPAPLADAASCCALPRRYPMRSASDP